MVLRMKNFNVLGVHQKIRKTNVEGGIAKKGVLRQFCHFKEGAWQETGVVVFLRGVDTPKHTMSHFDIF